MSNVKPTTKLPALTMIRAIRNFITTYLDEPSFQLIHDICHLFGALRNPARATAPAAIYVVLGCHAVHSGIAHPRLPVNSGIRRHRRLVAKNYGADFSNSSAFCRSAAASAFLPWRSSALASPRCASA